MSLCQPVIWSMAAILRDSIVVVVVAAVVVRTRPRGIPLAMITMRKSTLGFPFVSHIWVAYGAPLGGPPELRYKARLQSLERVTKEQTTHPALKTCTFTIRYKHLEQSLCL